MRFVAVSQRIDEYSERNETRDALDHRLNSFILEAGMLPLPVPNNLTEVPRADQPAKKALHFLLENIEPVGFLLSGGNDIASCVNRDLTESLMLDYAYERKLPVLGICRGMQMMAHWSGTTLHRVSGHGGARHIISGTIVGEVNSYHKFSLSDCPPNFSVLARSEDGEIEAIRHLDLPWEGWMWHPEREALFVERDLERFRVLMNAYPPIPANSDCLR